MLYFIFFSYGTEYTLFMLQNVLIIMLLIVYLNNTQKKKKEQKTDVPYCTEFPVTAILRGVSQTLSSYVGKKNMQKTNSSNCKKQNVCMFTF